MENTLSPYMEKGHRGTPRRSSLEEGRGLCDPRRRRRVREGAPPTGGGGAGFLASSLSRRGPVRANVSAWGSEGSQRFNTWNTGIQILMGITHKYTHCAQVFRVSYNTNENRHTNTHTDMIQRYANSHVNITHKKHIGIEILIWVEKTTILKLDLLT